MTIDRRSSAPGAPKGRSRKHAAAFAAIALVALSFPSRARPQESRFDVDLELVLAVDVSSSMTAAEQRVQRQGYVSALRSADVLAAIKSGARGRIAIAYFEWARPSYQRVLVSWTVVAAADDAAAFADAIEAQPTASEGGTSISAALLRTAGLFDASPLRADRKVVDVSGDGPNNAGPPVTRARDVLIASGVTINGLAISLPAPPGSRRFESYAPEFVEAYYETCVIGGPAAFVLSVDDASQFDRIILRKLLSEIAGAPTRIERAAYEKRPPRVADCGAMVVSQFEFLGLADS